MTPTSIRLPDPADPRGLSLLARGCMHGDFYFTREGYVVWTEQYHLRRGECCENNCRHCPYGRGGGQR